VALPDWVIISSPVLGGITGAVAGAIFSGYVVTRWKAREDQIEKRIDELCTATHEIASLAAAYWAGTPQDPSMNVREAQIIASMRRIAGLRVLLSEFVSRASDAEIVAAEAFFIRSVTGGDFGVHNRTADSERMLACQYAAAEMVLAARRSRLLDLRGLWPRA
jgi:hypothetical protein